MSAELVHSGPLHFEAKRGRKKGRWYPVQASLDATGQLALQFSPSETPLRHAATQLSFPPATFRLVAAPSSPRQHSCFSLAQGRQEYHFATDSLEECQVWTKHLEAAREEAMPLEAPPAYEDDAGEPSPRSEDALMKALDLVVALRLADAEQLLEGNTADDFYLHFVALLPMFLRATIGERESASKKFMSAWREFNSHALPFCPYCSDSSLLSFWKSSPKVPLAHEMDRLTAGPLIAFATLLKALVQLRFSKFVKGPLNLRAAWMYYLDCQRVLDAHSVDSLPPLFVQGTQLGVALFQFLVSLVPSSFTKIAEMLGFESNRVEGWATLQHLSSIPSLFGRCARVVTLAITQWMHNDHAATITTFTALQQRPADAALLPLGYFISGYAYRAQGDASRAREHFEASAALLDQLPELQVVCRSEVGDCHVRVGEWQLAADCYEDFLARNKSKSFRCWVAYELGVCYCLLGQQKKARESFKQCQSWVRSHFSYDVYAGRMSTQFLKQEGLMSEFDRVYFAAESRRRVRRFQDSIDLVSAISTVELTNDQLALRSLLLGRDYAGLAHYAQAEAELQRVSTWKLKHETYTVPHALVERAEVCFATDRKQEGVALLTQAREKYSNYDFDKPLRRRIMKLLDQADAVKKKK